MVADLSSTPTTPKPKVLPPASAPAKPKRVPLVVSDNNNNGGSLQRRPKPKNVTSRYLSYSNSVTTATKRFPSLSPATNRRDQSVEMSTSAKMLTKTSARSLSVSFQGESFALPVSKVGKPATNGLKTGTPERKKAPSTVTTGRSRRESFMTMSVDFTGEKPELSKSETAGEVRVLQKSITAETKLGHNKPETVRECDNPKLTRSITAEMNLEHNKPEIVPDFDNSDHTDSDPESISSGSTVGHVRGGPRAIVVPARFWQETINLLRRVQPQPQRKPVPVSSPPPLLKNNKMSYGYKVLHDGAKVAPRGSSLLKNDSLGNTVSILSFCADAKRGKVGEKKLLDAHVLRVLHNKHMQWRFANAKVDAAMVVQRAAAQKTLYNAWVTISKLWHSVISKRLQLQQLKHNLKLHSLLKKQMLHLDNWDITERDYSISLADAIMALESSSLCLPVISGAKADVQNLKDAICSAVDVMQDMAVSIYSLVTKVENVNFMASELANAMKTECSLLDQCKDLLSTLTLLEQQDCSLRAHALQLMPVATMTQRPEMMPF
ncbi:protein SNOWY COTYLEDON 3 isoform X1 [Helianthus annuus]|uniref:Putative QWRF family n=1 Tax=Helianthus annuus TaxID=4232 RepID=A0A251VRU8_HELAN|nr:protein SNOWY COTYLEDON 3 isoform X1 [Helianthus annuus]